MSQHWLHALSWNNILDDIFNKRHTHTRAHIYIYIYHPWQIDVIFFDISVLLFFGSTINDKSKPTSKCCLLQNPSCRCPAFVPILVYLPVWPILVVNWLRAARFVHGGFGDLLVLVFWVIDGLWFNVFVLWVTDGLWFNVFVFWAIGALWFNVFVLWAIDGLWFNVFDLWVIDGL